MKIVKQGWSWTLKCNFCFFGSTTFKRRWFFSLLWTFLRNWLRKCFNALGIFIIRLPFNCMCTVIVVLSLVVIFIATDMLTEASLFDTLLNDLWIFEGKIAILWFLSFFFYLSLMLFLLLLFAKNLLYFSCFIAYQSQCVHLLSASWFLFVLDIRK